MNLDTRELFWKELRTIHDQSVLREIYEEMSQLKQARSPHEVNHMKKLKGKANHWSLRLGDYRVGIVFQDGVFILARVMHRREFYRFFP